MESSRLLRRQIIILRNERTGAMSYCDTMSIYFRESVKRLALLVLEKASLNSRKIFLVNY